MRLSRHYTLRLVNEAIPGSGGRTAKYMYCYCEIFIDIT